MFEVVKVEPVGERESFAFVMRKTCAMEQIVVPVYPASPLGDDMRTVRVMLGLGIREVARALGLDPEQYSGIEWGRYTFVAATDWDNALSVLKSLGTRATGA